MATIEQYDVKKGRNKRERQRWRVIYRRPDHKQTTKSGFTTKRDAEQFVNTVEVAKHRGEYIDPGKSRVLVEDLAETWLKHKKATTKPSTFQTYESRWRIHVKNRWGHIAVSKVRASDVQTWVAELHAGKPGATPPLKPLSGSLIADCFTVLSGVLDLAEKDRSILTNPLRGRVQLPRRNEQPKIYLQHHEVRALADASTHPEIILTLAYTGLRWGELTGLRVKHIEHATRRIRVDTSITILRNGEVSETAPKTHERRVIVFPALLAEILAEQCARKHRDEFVFNSPNGGMLKPPSSQTGWFGMAVKRSGLPNLSPHDLRHTTASLAVSAGANVKALQRMLGHASAAMTLDRYADLFDEDLVAVADALDVAAQAKAA